MPSARAPDYEPASAFCFRPSAAPPSRKLRTWPSTGPRSSMPSIRPGSTSRPYEARVRPPPRSSKVHQPRRDFVSPFSWTHSIPVGSSYENRSRAFTVLTLASDSVSTSAARRSPSPPRTSTSSTEPCHSGAPAMSAAMSKQRSIGASISTVFSPVMFAIPDGTLPDQRELLSARQALDPDLLAHCLGSVRARRAPDQLDRPAPARVAAPPPPPVAAPGPPGGGG